MVLGGRKMNVHGRLLRVLLIHDSQFKGIGSTAERALATKNLEVLEMPRYRSSERATAPQIGRWEDHLELWRRLAAGESLPRPELVLIDCNFEEDNKGYGAPVLEQDGDPRGLLYGAIQIAWLLGKQPWAPFGMAIYSVDMQRFANDPMAQTFFGYLSAMQGELPLGGRDTDLHTEFTKQMAEWSERRGADPTDSWPSALVDYRKRLLEAFRRGDCVPRADSLGPLREAVSRAIAGEVGGPDMEASVVWAAAEDVEEQRVLARSLFADCLSNGVWDLGGEKGHEVDSWLAAAIRADRSKFENTVSEWVEREFANPAARSGLSAKPSRRIDSTAVRNKGPLFHGYDTETARGLAIVFIWLRIWFEERRAPDKEQVEAILLPESMDGSIDQQLRRAVTKIGLKGVKPSEFFARLQSGEAWGPAYPHWVWRAARRYVSEKLVDPATGRQPAPDSWPRWLREREPGKRDVLRPATAAAAASTETGKT